jgi:hypothetical protein
MPRDRRAATGLGFFEIEPLMKPRSIQSLLLVAALFTPLLGAQDAPAKLREIEQKVLLTQYQKAVHALVGSAREAEGDATGETVDMLGKRTEWVVMVGDQIKGEKVAPAKRKEMTESAGTLNELAWNMITAKDADARHPDVALKLVNIAIELSGGGGILKPNMLDTKARALFLLGKRDEAIAEQDKAVAAATIPMDKAEFEATLAAYRKGELPELSSPATAGVPAVPAAGTMYLLEKLRSIVIPSVDFDNATLEEAAEFLRKRSIELDTTESDPARKGLNIVVRHPVEKPGTAPGKGEGKPEAVRIKELHLRNVPLSEALKYVCQATRYRYKVDDFAVTLVSPDAQEDLFNRTFRVPPGFGSSLAPIQELLKLCGVKFGEGASATLMPSGMLVVRNTPSDLDKIEMLIEADINARASQEAPEQPPSEAAPAPKKPDEK